MAQPIDFYFFVGSLHTYLAVMRIGEAIDAGIEVRWRPFNLRAIMMEQNNIPTRNVVKMKYIYRDVARRAKRFGYPFEGVPKYPFDSDLLANRVAVVAAQQGWCHEYLTAVYRSWMVEHGSPDTPEGLTPLLKALGKEPALVLTAARLRRDPGPARRHDRRGSLPWHFWRAHLCRRQGDLLGQRPFRRRP